MSILSVLEDILGDVGMVNMGSDREGLVHADGRFGVIGTALADELSRLMRDGQGLPEDAELCWGCVVTVIRTMVFEVVRQNRHPDVTPAELIGAIGTELMDTARTVRRLPGSDIQHSFLELLQRTGAMDEEAGRVEYDAWVDDHRKEIKDHV